MLKKKIVYTSFGVLFVVLINSCTSVKNYQKVFLNDEEMKLAARKLELYESTFQTYREGSSGAEGGKSGGGCGCN